MTLKKISETGLWI